MLGNFAFLLSSDFFSELPFSKNSFRNTISISHDWIQTRPDILSGLIRVQNCLQRLSADDTNRQRTTCKVYCFEQLCKLSNLFKAEIIFFEFGVMSYLCILS